jgi:hypothetical protein
LFKCSNALPADVANGGVLIVGIYNGKAVIWDEQNGVRDLKLFTEAHLGEDLSGWVLVTASALSENGMHIVGSMKAADQHSEGYLLSIPPECSSEW